MMLKRQRLLIALASRWETAPVHRTAVIVSGGSQLIHVCKHLIKLCPTQVVPPAVVRVGATVRAVLDLVNAVHTTMTQLRRQKSLLMLREVISRFQTLQEYQPQNTDHKRQHPSHIPTFNLKCHSVAPTLRAHTQKLLHQHRTQLRSGLIALSRGLTQIQYAKALNLRCPWQIGTVNQRQPMRIGLLLHPQFLEEEM
jgi:hypothetical protein